MTEAPDPRPETNRRTAFKAAGVVVLMGALAWISVPAYRLFCQVTGFGGTTAVSETAPDVVLDRTVTVRFDASVARDMPWTFKPVQRQMEVRLGETGLAFYEATNPTDTPVAGSATFNVYPYEAGGFFTKIACFCFEEQVLQPGESVMMPVSFYVDPEMIDDRDAKNVHSITLSYTFYEIDLPDPDGGEQAALDTPRTVDVN